MTTEATKVSQLIQSMIARILSKGSGSTTDTENLVLRLNEQFPNDIGIFSALLLNYIRLEPGEAIFLAANEPHAYISGMTRRVLTYTSKVNVQSAWLPLTMLLELA
jgi:mannose-6-phosphate isomerase